MSFKVVWIVVVGAMMLVSLAPAPAQALSGEQFAAACDAYEGECKDMPLIQAYVGGALDLIAMLDEETEYLEEVYCMDTGQLFVMPEIINFMQQRASAHGSRNAMLLFIAYLEERGGCPN